MNRKFKSKKNRNQSSPKSPKHEATNWHELNQLAEHLNDLARTQLRNGVLGGVLRGWEDEIRQDAVLMVLEWHLRGQSSRACGSEPETTRVSSRLLPSALRLTKLRFLRKLSGNQATAQLIEVSDGGYCLHHFRKPIDEWPEESVREMIRQAIYTAARTGRISQQNACVALLVYHDGVPVTEVARRLGRNRSAINQQLARVRRELAPILETIELPHPF